MKTVAWVILVAALMCGFGCTHPDWIDRTLVTVDVTGTWQGVSKTGFLLTFNLRQEGSNVTGSVQVYGGAVSPDHSGPVVGTVAGDVFSFSQTNGYRSGEMTVSGDEMSGRLNVTAQGPQIFTLRRVDSSSPPSSPKP